MAPRIGPYEVIERLGAGGMGDVYLGVAPSGRRVAIKVIKPEYAADPGFRSRFGREVAAARKVGGAFTAPVVDADPDAGEPWFATVYIPGPSLDAVVRGHGPLDAHAVLRLAAGLIDALTDIHGAGLIHRDLKPANILITEHDGPRVIDFGIARDTGRSLLVSTGAGFGTPAYMAPEQIESGTAGYASDVFALGSVLLFAATGRLAFPAESPIAVMGRILYGVPDLDDLHPDVADLIGACLTKRPEDRPTLPALAALVTRRLMSQGPLPEPEPEPEPERAPASSPDPVAPRGASSRRDRRRLAAVLVTTLVIAAGAGAALQYVPFTDDPPGASAQEDRTNTSTSGGTSSPVSAPTDITPIATSAIDGGKSLPNNGTWCTPNMIRLRVQPAEPGKVVFAAGQNVALKLIVTNRTGPTCYVDFAPASAYIEVFSGSDRYWGSADCTSGAATDVRQIQQGETQQVALSHDWAWTRSDVTKCANNGGQTRISPPAGTAFYARGTLANLDSSGEYVFRVDGI